MKEMWRQFRKGAIVVSCGMLALGILMALWPDISALTVCIAFGIFCIVAGVYTRPCIPPSRHNGNQTPGAWSAFLTL